jgi:hypothetical protein
MFRLFAVLTAILVVPVFAPADPPASNEPIGKWQVKFANGVVETCAFEQGKASETEPLRTSTGKLVLEEGAVVIAFEDDRTERWTAVGTKWVVEHWFPSSSYPTGRPVVGIAKRHP